MSYILDALRKSEAERDLGEFVPARDPAFDITAPKHPWLRLTAIGMVLVAAVGAGLLWFLNRGPEPDVQAPVAVASAPAPPAVPTRDLARQAVVPREAVKDSAPPAHSQRPSAPPAPPVSVSRAEGIKFLRAMPASFRNRLPALQINIHVYAPDPAQQILYINNREVKPGQRVDGGAVLESITPDGAVLRLNDTRFKLPRPS